MFDNVNRVLNKPCALNFDFVSPMFGNKSRRACDN